MFKKFLIKSAILPITFLPFASLTYSAKSSISKKENKIEDNSISKFHRSNQKTKKCKKSITTSPEKAALESELAKFPRYWYSKDFKPVYKTLAPGQKRVALDKKIFTSIEGYVDPKLSKGFSFSVYNEWTLPKKINIGVFTIEISNGKDTASKDIWVIFACEPF